MVSGVQAKFVEQGFRERGPNTRCAEQDAGPYWESPSLLKRLTGYTWWVKAVEEAL